MERVAIVGAGALAREALDIFDACTAAGAAINVLGFVAEEGFGEVGSVIRGKPVLGRLDWFRDHPDVRAFCALGYPEHRRALVERLKLLGVRFCNAIHPRATLTKWVTIGEDVMIAAGASFTNGITLEDHSHVNPGCTIGHDVTLREYATLAPGVHLSGYVTVAAGVFVGSGATLTQRVTVGEWSIVGAGAVVIQDVPANATAFGVPARIARTRTAGWHLTL